MNFGVDHTLKDQSKTETCMHSVKIERFYFHDSF